MQRVSLGLAALFLLIAGGVIAIQQPEGGAVFAGACVRVGMVLGALWLALPQVTRFWKQTPKWLLIAAGVALVVVVIHPMYALAAVPLLALLWFFGPKLAAIWKRKPGTTATAATRPPEAPAAKPEPAAPSPRPRRRSNAR
jgi:hypothetical protein